MITRVLVRDVLMNLILGSSKPCFSKQGRFAHSFRALRFLNPLGHATRMVMRFWLKSRAWGLQGQTLLLSTQSTMYPRARMR
jgi:hypothetical protein